jgi:L-alanine-DL-glutamate epimerase-like enolase superfamily enzyme
VKISAVRTRPFRINLNRPIGDANSPHGRRAFAGLIVSVHCDAGPTGIAIAPADAGDAIGGLAELLVGADPRGVRGLWQRMNDALFKGGAVGVAGDAMGSLDVALWDLKGKLAGEPLWRLLGAGEPRARAYASGLDLPLSDAELDAYYRRMAAAGVRAGKLKVGLDLDHDLRRLAIVRDALAPATATSTAGTGAPALMIDANEYWSPKQAVRRVAVFEERFDLTWVEEPARRWDYRGLRTVSRGIRAAVATGENLDCLAQYRPLVEHGAVDIVQVGTNAGGITGALQVAELAYAFDLPVAMMNSPGSFLAHVAAALPNHLMIEVLDAGRGAIFDRDLELRDGYVHIGERPGLGMVLNEERLAAAEAAAREAAQGDGGLNAGAVPAGRRAGAGLIEQPPDQWP